MPQSSDCWICQKPSNHDGDAVDCVTCGRYGITGSLRASQFPADVERHRLSYWIKRRTLEGNQRTILSNHSLEEILAQLTSPATQEKPDILLVSLGLAFPVPGEFIATNPSRDYSLACARGPQEFSFHQKSLIERGHLQASPPGILIKESGWARIAELTVYPAVTRRAFVAMKFNTEMFEIWKIALSPAITDAGFEPRLVGDPEHNDRIDDRIIVELKQCRFVVADVTFSSPGAYFEAGYAIGMQRPVIWTCREDRAKQDMHFDTRQYNHVLWTDATDLRLKLKRRIVATI